jgi:adenylate cyclase
MSSPQHLANTTELKPSSVWNKVQSIVPGTIAARPLSARVVTAIGQHDQSSEVLIKIIQLVIVSIWAVLYALAPKTDFGTAFSPVSWALAIYFALNVVGLIWARRTGLPNWAVYLSIIFDIAILMVLIWSFHIQYDQPPSFYLKAPTLLYVFIFIALRALRFQARFVIFSGLAAAAGWLTLVAYAVFSAHGMSTTRNYIEYLTGNEILLGAEFDKIITIIMVAGIIAVALSRANDLLVKATTDAQAANELSRYFDSAVASDIRNSDEAAVPGKGKRVEAAILNVDLRGFTSYASGKDAEKVLGLLIAYQKRIVGIIQSHGGSIDKFMGDGIMATFGAVRANETYAADAMRAIDAIIAETDTWNTDETLKIFSGGKVNAAVAAGPIVFGTIGDDSRLEFTVIGSAANLSAKLEKHNKKTKSRALTDADTYAVAVRQGYQPTSAHRKRKSTLAGVDQLVVLG